MMRTKLLALAAAIAAAVIPCATAPYALADPPDYVPINWDGTTTNLDWVGGQYATTQDSFVGTPVAVPGDFESRTAVVRNAGPSDATAVVELINVAVVTPPEAVNTDFQDCVHIFIETNGKRYDATWREALDASIGGTSWLTSFPVAMDAAFSITAGAYFPVDETRGQSDGRPSQALSFDVRVTMGGDTPAPAPQVHTGGHAVPHHLPLLLALSVVGSSLAVILTWAITGYILRMRIHSTSWSGPLPMTTVARSLVGRMLRFRLGPLVVSQISLAMAKASSSGIVANWRK